MMERKLVCCVVCALVLAAALPLRASFAGTDVFLPSVGRGPGKAGGSFRIDHPLDPANRYLSHSFVESPDMMHVYNGNVILDGRGEAVVELPRWFEALNRDFRYQLTAIGAPGPNLFIAEEISRNRFKVAGGIPGMKVSWQVTGIRHDPWAEAHRIPVEEEKPEGERGRCLHPELYGQPEQAGESWKVDHRSEEGTERRR